MLPEPLSLHCSLYFWGLTLVEFLRIFLVHDREKYLLASFVGNECVSWSPLTCQALSIPLQDAVMFSVHWKPATYREEGEWSSETRETAEKVLPGLKLLAVLLFVGCWHLRDMKGTRNDKLPMTSEHRWKEIQKGVQSGSTSLERHVTGNQRSSGGMLPGSCLPILVLTHIDCGLIRGPPMQRIVWPGATSVLQYSGVSQETGLERVVPLTLPFFSRLWIFQGI